MIYAWQRASGSYYSSSGGKYKHCRDEDTSGGVLGRAAGALTLSKERFSVDVATRTNLCEPKVMLYLYILV